MTVAQSSVRNGYRRFLRSWLDDPFAVGAVAPSGRSLAKLMTRELGPGDRVIELGPGTGTVTRAILGRGVRPEDLVLIERGRRFADRLCRDFPDVTVLKGDATVAQEALAGCHGTFDYVISGLPLVLFSREQKSRVLQQSLSYLNDSGAMLQFTYGGRCPVDRRELERHGLTRRCVGFIALNVPPAFVYRIARVRATGERRRS
jgi:phospholipid N-methyltransferase